MEEEKPEEVSEEVNPELLLEQNKTLVGSLPELLLEHLLSYDRAHNEESNDVFGSMEESTFT